MHWQARQVKVGGSRVCSSWRRSQSTEYESAKICALQECSLTPVLVKPVEQESTAAVDVDSSTDVEEVRIKPAESDVSIEVETTEPTRVFRIQLS